MDLIIVANLVALSN